MSQRPFTDLLGALRILFGVAASLLVLLFAGAYAMGAPALSYVPGDAELIGRIVMLAVIGVASGAVSTLPGQKAWRLRIFDLISLNSTSLITPASSSFLARSRASSAVSSASAGPVPAG